MPTIQNDVQTDLVFNAETKKAQANLDALHKRMQAIKEGADKAEESFRTLGDVSTGFAASAALIFAPAILAAEKYVQVVGKSEKVSRQYIALQERQQKAQIEFGRKSAQALLPYRELLTDIVETLAKVDPRILQAGIAIGGGLALVGAAGLIASQIGLFATAVVKLGTYINTLSAVQASGGLGNIARVGAGIGIAGAAGAGIGIVGAQGLQRAGVINRAELEGADTGEVFKVLLDDLKHIFVGLIGAVLAGKTAWQLIAVDLQTAGQVGKEKLAETLDQLVATLDLAVVGIKEFLLGLELDTKLFGKLNIGEELGLNRDEVAARRQEIEARTRDASQLVGIIQDAEARKQEIRDKFGEEIEALKAAFDTTRFGDVRESPEEQAQTFSDESLDLFDEFRENEKAAAENYQKERKALNARFADENLKLETEYNRQRKQQLEDFNKGQAQAEKDFDRTRKRQVADNARQIADLRKQASEADKEALAEYNDNRAATITQFNRDEIKRQQDFDRRRKRQQEETNERLLDAAGKLDAQAIFQILRESTKTAKQENQDFGSETTSRQAELQQRLADDKKVFDQQKQQRQKQLQESITENQRQFAESQRLAKEDFEYRQQLERQRFTESRAREAENFTRQMQERRVAHVKELNDLQNAYNQQKKARQAQFLDAYNQLNGFQQYEASARQAHYKRLAADLQNFLNGVNAASAPARQSGGTRQRAQFSQYADGTDYVPSTGLAMLHRGERVLTEQENQRFTQRGLQSLVRGGSQAVNNNNQRSITIQSLNVTPPPGMAMSESEFARFFDKRLITVLDSYGGA